MSMRQQKHNDVEKWEQVSGWMVAASAVVLGMIAVWPVMKPWLDTRVQQAHAVEQQRIHQALIAQETAQEPTPVRLSAHDRVFLEQMLADL